MDHILYWQKTYRWTLSVIGTIGTVMRAVTREHTLALHAATKALSPRQSLPEVRAMYVPTAQSQQEMPTDALGKAIDTRTKAMRSICIAKPAEVDFYSNRHGFP